MRMVGQFDVGIKDASVDGGYIVTVNDAEMLRIRGRCNERFSWWECLHWDVVSYLACDIVPKATGCSVFDNQLAVEVPVVHHVVRFADPVQREGPAHDAPQRSLVHHLHGVGHGPATTPAAAHQVQGTTVEDGQVHGRLAAGGDAG